MPNHSSLTNRLRMEIAELNIEIADLKRQLKRAAEICMDQGRDIANAHIQLMRREEPGAN